jgi:hypothetical protein
MRFRDWHFVKSISQVLVSYWNADTTEKRLANLSISIKKKHLVAASITKGYCKTIKALHTTITSLNVYHRQ